jgi:hypothetical protein
LLNDDPSVAFSEIDASVLVPGVTDPVAVIVRFVDLKKFPAVKVPLVQSLTTSVVGASAVPVHSMTA